MAATEFPCTAGFMNSEGEDSSDEENKEENVGAQAGEDNDDSENENAQVGAQGYDDEGEDEGEADEEKEPEKAEAAAPKWNTAEITFQKSFSLDELAADKDGKIAVLKLSEEISAFGAKKEHLLDGIDLVDLETDLPVTVSLDLGGIKADKVDRYTHTNAKGVYIVRRREKWSNPRRVALTKRSAKTNVRFLQAYSGWTLDNIDDGINWLDKDTALVKKDHPLIAIINEVAKQPLTKDDIKLKGWYSISRATVSHSLEWLKQEMEDKLPLTDLTKLRFTISRAITTKGTSDNGSDSVGVKMLGTESALWLDSAEVFDNLDAKRSKEAATAQRYSIYMKLEVRWRPGWSTHSD